MVMAGRNSALALGIVTSNVAPPKGAARLQTDDESANAPPSKKGLPATGCSIPSFHQMALHSATVLPKAEAPGGMMRGLGLPPTARSDDVAANRLNTTTACVAL